MQATKDDARPTTTRMFESDLVERFSRINPVTPFVFWLPVLCFLLGRAVMRHEVAPLPMAGLVLGGVFFWTFAEYVLHRYVFHFVRESAFWRRFHFLIHGVHHDFPDDKDRLVMPLGASIPMGVGFFSLFSLTLGAAAAPFFVGFGLGYLAYDGTHFALHHFKLTGSIGKALRKHHMLHHHLDHAGGFGVSSPLWDLVFRTMPQPRKRAAKSA
ncbi:MAG TPA: sterol desaturase family protein [Polyangiaceae bacterium]|jgi:sterol desaturase/sphingolipid hydroxylase (fatty acid hydroxylase superfamily)|nr:sterol desaturase family protein [Polyangiaceae bacterium]